MEPNIQKIRDLLDCIPEIEKLLTPMRGNFMPDTKTIYKKAEFQKWRAELKHQLPNLKQDAIVAEAIQLINDGFQSGWTDEKDFLKLKANLSVIAENLEDYIKTTEQPKETEVWEHMRLKRGSLVKTAYDDYTLGEQVGTGGNGRVFSATNKSGENVAIKFVQRNISTEKLKRFKNEINFCERHQHKNIVQILDRGYVYLDDTDYVFYVMPLYKSTLRERIVNGIPHEQVMDIFIGIIEGLRYAHSCGAIHRDIKPENIMFADGSDEPILCDFGIAHFSEEDLITAVETKQKDRMANFQYAAPEQRAKGVPASAQTDIYAVALILNEMFTKEIPQATGYKKIGDVDASYKFLDDLFDKLYMQDPAQRLFPEEKILSEMKLLAEKHKRAEERAKLESVVTELIDPGDFEVKIVDKEYRDGNFVFIFDKELPVEWYQFIAYGSYPHSCIVGYEPCQLTQFGKNELAMPLRGDEGQEHLITILRNMKDWVNIANLEYSRNQRYKASEAQRRKDAERRAQMEHSEKEDKFATMIANL